MAEVAQDGGGDAERQRLRVQQQSVPHVEDLTQGEHVCRKEGC